MKKISYNILIGKFVEDVFLVEEL